MERNEPVTFDIQQVETPCFVVDTDLIRQNLCVLGRVKQQTGAKILLALKAFSMFSVFPLIRETLDGICASSPWEARLGYEEFGREVHSFAAAYSERDMQTLIPMCDHMVFNSFGQWQRFKPMVEGANRELSCGIRINPEHSEGSVPLYDPCAPGSRLGVRFSDFKHQHLSGIRGLHFHTLCEQNAHALDRTVTALEKNFAPCLHTMDWINFGGGHHITRSDYDVDLLCAIIKRISKSYNLQVYLEPGEAVALNTGFLVASVLDIIQNDMPIAILDTSAPTHMPDVLEMPYRPHVLGSGATGEKKYSYRLAGLSCLAGDVIGEYSFDSPLGVGDRLVFTDMAHYSMVKTNTFNGIRLPSIYSYNPSSKHLMLIRRFSYQDFKTRLS